MTEILIVLSIIMTTIGQLFLKKASVNGGLINIYLWSGYFLFVIVLIISYILMKLIDLKYFTMIMSVNYISVYVSSAYFFNEKVTKNKIIGILLIICGLIVFKL